MKSYAKIAPYYDRFVNKNFYKILNKYLADKILTSGEKKLLDLGTGTGFFPNYFASKGMFSVGIDQSKEMLKYANGYAKEMKLKNVQFINKDFMNIDYGEEFDYVTMFFDVINHIIEPQNISVLFKKINSALLPRGEFLLDILSLWGMKRMWGNDRFIEYHDDFNIFWTSSWDGRKQLLNISLKIKSDKGIVSEKFVERGYSTKFLVEKLEQNGFTVKNVMPLFFFKSKPSRYLIWAQKK
ncbi:class I SAM-dependent methyltransferase [bacterium]|nr:class I SAM-dependent methyltransferase [bacterium]